MRRDTLNRIAGLACGVLVLMSCGSRKEMAAAPVVNTPTATASTNNKAAKINEIRSRQLNFNTFSGKAETELAFNNDNKTVTLNVRIDRDKKIWVSITAQVLITIEVARAVITPDSIKIINKLQGVYMKKPFSFIHQYASKQVNYKTVESILVGNAAPELINENADLQPANGNITLTGEVQDLLYKLIFNPESKVVNVNMSNRAQTQGLEVTNSEFVQVAGRVVPSRIVLSSTSGGKKVAANMHYTKIDLDQPQDYPFNIPDSYSPAN
jgi:hypothetical protein